MAKLGLPSIMFFWIEIVSDKLFKITLIVLAVLVFISNRLE